MAGGAGGYGNDDDSGRMIVDINVTPLVDITLVLLIIFMVTASLIVNPAIKVDLPKAASGTETDQDHAGADAGQGRRAVPERSAQQRRGRRPLHRRRASEEPASCRRSSPPTRRSPRRRRPRHRSRQALGRPPVRDQHRPGTGRQVTQRGCSPEKVFRTCGHRARRRARRGAGDRDRGRLARRCWRSAVVVVDPQRFRADKPIEIDVEEKLPPPEVKPPPPEDKPPPPEPRPRIVAAPADRRAAAADAAAAQRRAAAKADDPPPNFGVSLNATTSGDSSVAVPVGNTLMTKPGPKLEKPKPLAGDGAGGGFVPVADIYISQHAELISMPSGEEIYPPEAKRLGIEGVGRIEAGHRREGQRRPGQGARARRPRLRRGRRQGREAGQVQAGDDQRRPGRPLQHHLDLPLRDRTLRPEVRGPSSAGFRAFVDL